MDQRPRVLVIEDEMLLAMYLANLVEDFGYSAVGPVGRVVTAVPIVIKESLDAALLDFDLAGESVEPIANVLERRGIPFALITVSTRDQLPAKLRGRPHIKKPFADEQIRAILAELLARG